MYPRGLLHCLVMKETFAYYVFFTPSLSGAVTNTEVEQNCSAAKETPYALINNLTLER